LTTEAQLQLTSHPTKASEKMKLTRILTITAALLAFAIPASSFAAKEKGKGKETKNPAKKAAAAALNIHDKDSNGAINGDEIAEVRKAFDADKTGPLKPLDVNADGTLDDNKIAAIQKGKKGKGKKGEGKKRKGKKGAAEPAPAAPAPAAPAPAAPAPAAAQ